MSSQMPSLPSVADTGFDENTESLSESPSEAHFFATTHSVVSGLDDMASEAVLLTESLPSLSPTSPSGQVTGIHQTLIDQSGFSNLFQNCGVAVDETLDVSSFPDMILSSNAFLGIEAVPLEYLNELYQSYFDITHRTFPLLEFNTFSTIASSTFSSNDTIALRCAVCAHGVAKSLKSTSWAVADFGFTSDKDFGAWLYRLAKYHLDLAENDCDGAASSLAALQATILVGLYELKHAYFSRAWVTTSKAAWLAQAFSPRKSEARRFVERRHSFASQTPSTPVSADDVESNNALWAVLNLTCFLCIGGSPMIVDTMIQNEIGVPLCVEDSLNMECPRLDDILKRSRRCRLSSKQGLSVATILCGRTIQHIEMMSHADPIDRHHYHYWTQHYHLDEAIRHVSVCASAGPTDSLGHTSENAGSHLVLELVLKATAICLHEALLSKIAVASQASPRSVTQAGASENLTLQNSLDIAHLAQTIVSTETAKANVFVPWTFHVAIQSLLRHQNRSTSVKGCYSRSSSVSSSLSSSSTSAEDLPFSFTGPPTDGAMFLGSDNRSGVTDVNSKSPTNFGHENTISVTLAEAIVMDSINALRSSMMELGQDSPMAKYFSDKTAADLQRSQTTRPTQPRGLLRWL